MRRHPDQYQQPGEVEQQCHYKSRRHAEQPVSEAQRIIFTQE